MTGRKLHFLKNNIMRRRIFEIIDIADTGDKASKVYDIFMMCTIVLSLLPLCFKEQTGVLTILDTVTVTIFIIDYLLRLLTADFKLKKGAFSFLRYPLTPMAIIDLLSILPSISVISNAFKVLKIFRLIRTFRVFRALKAFRYSKNIDIIVRVFKKQKDSLLVVCALAGFYILISALVIFNAEPETFGNYFEAVYWATVSLTTVGYGDIYAVSTVGKIITMISSVFGIAIVALPAGIITAGYLDELKNNNNDQ